MSAKKKKESNKKTVHETVIREVIEKPSKRKSTGKKTARKKSAPRKTAPQKDLRLEKALIENFVAFQKVMVNLSSKFEDLSGKISKLLELFEISAKALAEKDLNVEKTSRDDEKIIKKVDELSDQNKVIARGLLLMNDKLDEEPDSHGMRPIPQHHLPPNPGSIQQLQKSNQQQSQDKNKMIPKMEGYEKSIFSSQEPQKFKRLPGNDNAKTNF